MKVKKSDIYASVGTVVVCTLVLLLLFYFGMNAHHNEIDDGLMVSFGEELEGFGETEEIQPETAAESAASLPQPTPQPRVPVVEEQLMTQEDESVVLAQEKKRKEEQARQQAIAEEKRRAEEQRLQEEARKAEQARKAAEQQAKADKANNMASVFGTKVGDGSGSSTGNSMQGNPVGSGTSGGTGWSLSGRSLSGGIPKPAYSGSQQGRLVITIYVDRNGKVYNAEYNAAKSQISEPSLIEAAKESARQTKFSSGDGNLRGEITYNYSQR